jgi:phytoene dehydrogenase-like protein
VRHASVLPTRCAYARRAIALASIGAFARWRDARPGARGTEYLDLKRRLTERMLDAVEAFVPGFRERTVLRALGTPLTNVHFLQASNGAIYGTEKTLGNLGPFSLAVTTHIRGLHQAVAAPSLPASTA